ncbi:zinc-ribbon domain-containing protein [Streptomyces sp. NBC_01381]|uniref:zinc ribbon domain-containing protein n=1 Tax=Streptomyces sp. NBC_01381 TaxID=2903845 RepID=UPI002251C7FC|nr:zinc ribbon domain-containing protein [Streptomyces sp. NBC_01381]MCX4665190.1 zinc-ribbon domain-containing protein [Streptomyces sp. NBC_01381]
MASPQCPQCGSSIPDEARFCMKCGRERVRDTSVDAGPDVPPEAELGVPTGVESSGDEAAADAEPAVPAAPLSPPPPPPPPAPAFVPAPPSQPAAPSPVGAFLGRAFRGDWAGAAQAALWPVGLVLIAAVALAVPSYGQGDDGDDVLVGFGTRMRIALALLLQAVGGGFEISGGERQETMFGGGSSGGDLAFDGSATLHLIPLTATALWIGALFIGVRILRSRVLVRGGGHGGGGTAGLEAALRVTLLVTGGILVLGLFAQPEIEGVEISSSPVLATLGALVLALAVSCGVLHRADLGQWLAQRPAWQALFRATGTALRALAVVLVLCSVVAFISLTQIDDLAGAMDLDDADVSPLVIALLVLPNLGVALLGLGWGAPLDASVQSSSSGFGGGFEKESFGLSELGDVTNSWAVVGALALGLVCALILGVLAARRSAHRGEQLLAAGVFFGLVLLLAGVGGVGVEATGSASSEFGGGMSGSGNGSFDAGVSVPDALLFGLLWVSAAAFVAPFLLQILGRRPGVVPAPVPPMPAGPAGTGAPGAGVAPDASAAASAAASQAGPPAAFPAASPAGSPAAPPATSPAPAASPVPNASPVPAAASPIPAAASPVYDPHTFHLGQQPSKPRSRAGLWVGTLAAAFVVGGGAAAGVLLWQSNGDDKGDNVGKDDKPAVSRSEQPDGSPSPSATPTPTVEPTATPDAADDDETSGGQVPAGSELVSDVSGFEFAVPEGWSRQGEDRPGQIVYAGSTGREEFLVGVVPNATYTSYENFTTIEKDAKKDPEKSDYERIRLEPNTFQGRGGAIWEYTYTDTSGREIHALNQSYVADNGTEYAIQLSWRADFWPAGEGEKIHRIALERWRING